MKLKLNIANNENKAFSLNKLMCENKLLQIEKEEKYAL